MIAVGEFLRRYPPFDELPDDELEGVADPVRIEFFEADAEILRQGGDRSRVTVRRPRAQPS